LPPEWEGGGINIFGGRGHAAFVRGVNTLDLDVSEDGAGSSRSSRVLWIRPEVSGIAPPQEMTNSQ
jgi:hypothetical protein